MSTRAMLERQLSGLHRQRVDLTNRIGVLNRNLGRLENAIERIGRIQDSMSDARASYNNLDISNNRNWRGSKQTKAQEAHEQSGEGAKAYQDVLDEWQTELRSRNFAGGVALGDLEWQLQRLDFRISETRLDLSRAVD